MRGVYDLEAMQWFPLEDEESKFERELTKYEKIIRYKDKNIKSVSFDRLPIDGYFFTTEPIDPYRFYLIDEETDVYMFEDDMYDYLQDLFQ